MPAGASAAGAAFEVLSSRYLSLRVGLRHVAAPFYTRLISGKWVQFDGFFSRKDGATLVLEAKFHDRPVSLATPGIASRIVFAKGLGTSGIILTSRNGFGRDIMRLTLPVEKVLLSWKGMRKGLGAGGRGVLTAALDEVRRVEQGFQAASGAILALGPGEGLLQESDGFAFVAPGVERWLRRLPASPRDIDLSRPPRSSQLATPLDIESAWAIEDSLSGFAPSKPQLLEWTLHTLGSEPFGVRDAWKKLWRRGYRGREGGLKNALENLRVIGVVERFRSARGIFYAKSPEFAAFKNAQAALVEAARRWPAFVYFLRRTDGLEEDKNALSARFARDFAPMHPYARSLYNPAKVAGLLALRRYVSSLTSISSPS